MNLVSLLSSGIDSPVATYLLSKHATQIIAVHADTQPFTDKRELANYRKLISYLQQQLSLNIKAYIIPHGAALSAFKQHCNQRFTCVFCKRMLVRYADVIARKEHASALIMGDSLGQVASQTLQNLKTVDQATFLPILRPLIGFDKEDIISIARKIGTYDLSILPANPCGAVPKQPATQAAVQQLLEEEAKLDIDLLVKNAITNPVLL